MSHPCFSGFASLLLFHVLLILLFHSPAKISSEKMENREDLKSILPLLPLILRSSSLCWPSKALESLKALSRGPQYSEVDSGAILFDAIVDLRDSIGLSKERLPLHAADGYALFFDDVGWTVLVRSTPMCMWKKSMSISTSRIVGPTTDEAPSKNRTDLKAPSI